MITVYAAANAPQVTLCLCAAEMTISGITVRILLAWTT